jgi:hypothetical protein
MCRVSKLAPHKAYINVDIVAYARPHLKLPLLDSLLGSMSELKAVQSLLSWHEAYQGSKFGMDKDVI